MGIFEAYFETEAGLSTPSKSIKKLANFAYWCHLVLGVIAGVGCFIMALARFIEGFFAFGVLLLLGVVIVPLFFKLLGWLAAFPLRTIAVIVESHENALFYGRSYLSVQNRPVQKSGYQARKIKIAPTSYKKTDASQTETAVLPKEAESQAENAAQPESNQAEPVPPAQEQKQAPKHKTTQQEKLEYALRFTTDEGMMNYLKRNADEQIIELLDGPEDTLRARVMKALEDSKS